jgi:hypothetical protein
VTLDIERAERDQPIERIIACIGKVDSVRHAEHSKVDACSSDILPSR